MGLPSAGRAVLNATGTFSRTGLTDSAATEREKEAAATDALDKTVDYDGVVQKIGALMSANQCLLIEALTEKVADLVLTEFDISWTKVTLKKPGALPGEAYVALCIERGCSRPN